MKGYLLWVVQPWGKRYHLDTNEGQLQSELYYRHLGHADVATWAVVADLFAQGRAWPALEEIKQALRAHTPKQRALPGPDLTCPMPPEVKEKLDALFVEKSMVTKD